MKRAAFIIGPLLLSVPARADELSPEARQLVDKGLAWLVKQQQRDGAWWTGTANQQYPTAMTGLAGMALLMEGSTIREGRYAPQVRRAVEYLMEQCQGGEKRHGLIASKSPEEGARYMFGHGFALRFLATAYGDEEDRDRRERLGDVLTLAVHFAAKAQSTRGGWFYVSKEEGNDQDEGATTVAVLQGLRACRDAGLPVPREVLRKGHDYMKKYTTARGGVQYSSQSQSERPGLTAAALACTPVYEYKEPHVKK